jgi:hypothetical protein
MVQNSDYCRHKSMPVSGSAGVLRLCVATAVLAGCASEPLPDREWDDLPFGIELEHLAAVADIHEPGLLDVSRPPAVQMDSAGRFYAQTSGLAAIAVFGRQGEFLALLGRRGQGPGEFERTLPPLVGRGDSIIVFDQRLRRVTVFAPDFSYVRNAPVRHWPAIGLSSGGYIVAQQIPSPEHIGYPLHHVHDDGRILRSFGADTPYFIPGESEGTRHVAASRMGGVWSAAPDRSSVERWSVQTGERLQIVEPGNPVSDQASTVAGAIARPIIVGMWEDVDGFIWLLTRVMKPEAASAFDGSVEIAFDLLDYSASFDWILQAVDPDRGEIIASRRFPYYLGFRGPSRTLTTVRQIDVQGTVLDVPPSVAPRSPEGIAARWRNLRGRPDRRRLG